MRVVGIVTYDGKNYFGWQKQVNQSSIQEEIEKVISQILQTKISIVGSGRTDAGVHAYKQVFHFDIEKEVDLDRLCYSINCLLPDDIRVLSLNHTFNDFHSRYSALYKTYLYKFSTERVDVFNRFYVHEYLKPFNLCSFLKGLEAIKGTHCFINFTSKKVDEQNFVRTIYKTKLVYDKQKKIYNLYLTGSGFMRYMVRYLVGTLLAISSSSVSIDYLQNKLKNNSDRDIVNFKAPSLGLYLYKVGYKRWKCDN